MNINEISEKNRLTPEEKIIFDQYLHNKFTDREPSYEHNDDFLSEWYKILDYSEKHSPDEAINQYISNKYPVNFKDADGVSIELYQSCAGKIPVVCLSNADDFENLVTNTVYKGNRPENISQTGAMFVFGKTTRFIILSSKPYSNIPACEAGLSDEEWKVRSMLIRKEHECTHYFTKQVFGLSRNHLHDELIADFFGLYGAFGEYKSELFLRFMGIIGDNGGRLKVYTLSLPQKVVSAVSDAAVSASQYLESWSESDEFKTLDRKNRMLKLCSMGIGEMCL